MDRNRDSTLAHLLFWLVLGFVGSGEFQSAPYATAVDALPSDRPICGGLTTGRRQSRPLHRTVPYYSTAPDSRALRAHPAT
jgi:hypothetical protein